MANVQPGYTFQSASDPITASKLNLLAQPTVSLGAGEVMASNMSSSGIGYATGAGGTVAQGTNKSTTVILSKACGAITMNAAALGDATNVSFTVTNTLVAATDGVNVWHSSGGTLGVYQVQAHSFAAGSYKIMVRNVSGGSLSEAIVLTVSLVKGVVA